VLSESDDFRLWDRVISDWDVEFQGYASGDDDDATPGYVDFHLVIQVFEAYVSARGQKTYKKVMVPGYKVVVTENVAFPGEDWETWTIFEEGFKKKDLPKAIDVFRRELLNAQGIILVAKSRAKLIPAGKTAFECPFCGWATDSDDDDTMCLGCGKRFWSEKMWNGEGAE
jgi:hypothetical protein